jgi:hypothetical protein
MNIDYSVMSQQANTKKQKKLKIEEAEARLVLGLWGLEIV